MAQSSSNNLFLSAAKRRNPKRNVTPKKTKHLEGFEQRTLQAGKKGRQDNPLETVQMMEEIPADIWPKENFTQLETP